MLLEPGSPQWCHTVTASKIPAILGISRWTSQYACWQQMAGNDPGAPPPAAIQDVFDYGHAAETAAAQYWKFKNPGWRLSPGEVQYLRADLGFPVVATIDRRASRGSRRRVVEIKTARSLEEWGDDGTGEIPADYAAQLIWQQWVTGYTDPADLVLWPAFGYPRIYTVEHDAQLAEMIVDRVRTWVASLETGAPPDLDDTVSCYECVKRLHPDIDRDLEIQLDPDLAADYLAADAVAKDAQRRLRGLKTRVLDAMGRAQWANSGAYRIAQRRGNGTSVSLVAAKTDPLTIKEIA